MKRELVKNYKGLVKINNTFVVNENEEEYQLALMRLEREKKLKEMDNKINNLEEKMNLIIELLQKGT